jgi:hypothetical protein
MKQILTTSEQRNVLQDNQERAKERTRHESAASSVASSPIRSFACSVPELAPEELDAVTLRSSDGAACSSSAFASPRVMAPSPSAVLHTQSTPAFAKVRSFKLKDIDVVSEE